MTNQSSFPVGTQVQNFSQLCEVVEHHTAGTMLVVKGIGAYAHTGKWLASPDKCVELSDGHIGFSAGYEYFVKGTDLYRAWEMNPVVGCYRQGARMQMPTRLCDVAYFETLGLVAQ